MILEADIIYKGTWQIYEGFFTTTENTFEAS